MPWGDAGGQNIEHPHTLAILSSFVFVSNAFSFYGQGTVQASYTVLRQLILYIFFLYFSCSSKS